MQDPELPIVFVQLGSYIGRENDPLPQHRWISVRNDQYRIGRTLKRAVCVPAIDLELDDSIHLSNRAVTILGGRMADAMHLLVSENRNDQIFVKKISCRNEPLLNCAKLRIEFGNVQGSLQSSGGLPCGFAAVDKQGKLAAKAINTRLSGNTAEVLTPIPSMIFADEYMISYGAETQPCGNITDEAGRSLPCFMQKLPGRRGDFTSILQQALRSAAVYTDDRLEALTVPQELKWETAPFNTFYLPCPREVGELDRKPKIYCYKFKVRAEDDTNTELLMGADAPFLLYCDGKEFCRQQATNPVVLDEFVYPCRLSGGVHEFICVFSSNSGLGWGICCRFRKLKNEPAVEFVPVCEF